MKYKLKIKYHNTFGDWNKETLLEQKGNYFYDSSETLILNQDYVENNPDIFEELTPLFYTEDFKDGNFPKKSCGNCNFQKSKFECSHQENRNCTNKEYWQGELKGEPIYEGDEFYFMHYNSIKQNCPFVEFKYITTKDHNSCWENEEGKYFSNEKNAKIYYESLRKKQYILITESRGRFYQKNEVYLIEKNHKNGCYRVKDKNCSFYYDDCKLVDESYYEAFKLGFKIGDKVWSKHHKDYLGEIISFYNSSFNNIMLDVSKKTSYNLTYATNKVAIHTPTKEDFEFIWNKLNKSPEYDRSFNINSDKCIYLNENWWDTQNVIEQEGYLLLSIDEYMKSQDIQPLFKTEDGISIYDEYNQGWYCIDKLDLNYGVYPGGINNIHNKKLNLQDTNILRFSTRKLTQEYLNFKLYLGDVKIIIENSNIRAINKGHIAIGTWLKWYDKWCELKENLNSFNYGLTESWIFDYNGSEDISIGCINQISWDQIEKITNYIKNNKNVGN